MRRGEGAEEEKTKECGGRGGGLAKGGRKDQQDGGGGWLAKGGRKDQKGALRRWVGMAESE